MPRSFKAWFAAAIIGCILAAVAIALSLVQPPMSRTAPVTASSSGPSEKTIGPQPVPTSYVSNLGGTITKVGSGTITISSMVPTKPAPVVTMVSVGADTAIFEESPKDAATFQAQQAAYLQQPASSSTPPLPFTPQSLMFSQLKIGMLVNITLSQATDVDGTMHAIKIGVLPVAAKS